MPPPRKPARQRVKPARRKARAPARSARRQLTVRAILATLARHGSRRNVQGMARYGIVSPRAFGVTMPAMRDLARRIGRDHDQAARLWATGWHEARILAAFIDEPARVTPAQMDRWCRDFNNWAVCDGVCFHLFDRTPHAFAKIRQWARRRDEFVKRAAFALLASVAAHDKQAPDAAFLATLPLIERAATDERNFVKKGVSWALRGIGKRNPVLERAAVALARRLATSPDAAARWVGKDALRDLAKAR